jgi:phytoene dehydrogenase-like protein
VPEFDAVIVGGGHNGLVAATLLARAGRSVAVLERRARVGGAVASAAPFAGVGASVSQYSYLVSLFPAALVRSLGIEVELRPRRVPFAAPGAGSALAAEPGAWSRLDAMLGRVARRVFPTLSEPLRSREDLRRLVDDGEAWRALFEEPLSALLESAVESDVLRGVAATNAAIGTFAGADDAELRQNRCFLYHVIGNGTGSWDVPVGGMGALARALRSAARAAGAVIRTGVEVVAIATDGAEAEVTAAGGERFAARDVLSGVAAPVLARLRGRACAERPEGSQLKVNLVLARLPRLREVALAPEDAFTGTFHVNEGYAQLDHAYRQALSGRIPDLPPCELYCHSLTDPTILSPDLRASGAHALTIFGLHMPARLFEPDCEPAKAAALAATLRSVDSALAEPLEECLLIGEDGAPCVAAIAPPELERELGMPRGHIFHGDLQWPFAESEDDVGRWGVETDAANIWICGSSARRGGCVSGIPGHNAARAVLEARQGTR